MREFDHELADKSRIAHHAENRAKRQSIHDELVHVEHVIVCARSDIDHYSCARCHQSS